MATLSGVTRAGNFVTVDVPDASAVRGQESAHTSFQAPASAPASFEAPASAPALFQTPAGAGFQAPVPAQAASVSAGVQAAAFTQFNAPAVQQPAQVAGVVPDSHAATETGGGGIVRDSYADASSGSAPVDQMHFSDYGWHIVPSVESQYGEAAPASDQWHQFAADFIPQDWFYA